MQHLDGGTLVRLWQTKQAWTGRNDEAWRDQFTAPADALGMIIQLAWANSIFFRCLVPMIETDRTLSRRSGAPGQSAGRSSTTPAIRSGVARRPATPRPGQTVPTRVLCNNPRDITSRQHRRDQFQLVTGIHRHHHHPREPFAFKVSTSPSNNPKSDH